MTSISAFFKVSQLVIPDGTNRVRKIFFQGISGMTFSVFSLFLSKVTICDLRLRKVFEVPIWHLKRPPCLRSQIATSKESHFAIP